jgi:hypothetical protein
MVLSSRLPAWVVGHYVAAAPSSPIPAATKPTVTAGCSGDAATSTTQGKPTMAGTPTSTSCQDNDLQLPYQ